MNTLSKPNFQGFSKPEANFFRLPNEWTDITANITSLAEMKVVEYVLRHTWGYSEYDLVKKITTDEFMHGRKRIDGTRIDKGTGLSNKSVVEGLSKAVEHGLLEVEVDDSDRARIKKLLSLRKSYPSVFHEVSENRTPVSLSTAVYTKLEPSGSEGGKGSVSPACIRLAQISLSAR
jgi:hypothetical protein